MNPAPTPIILSDLLCPKSILGGFRQVLSPEGIKRHVALPALIGIVFAVLIYFLLPLFGVEQFANLFSFKMMFVLGFLLAAAVGYWFFLDIVKARPSWLLYTTFIGLPILTWVSNIGLTNGINLYKTVWLMGGVCAPAVFIGLPHLRKLWRRLPIFKYFVLYLIVAIYFYLFNNHLVYDQRFTAGSQPISFHAFFTSVYHFLTVTIVGCTVFAEKKPLQTFNAFNMIVLWMTLIYSIICLVTYPFKIFTELLEGVERTRFIFLFTNEYSFYMQFLVTYLLGVYFYQVEVRSRDISSRFPWQIMYPVTIIIGVLAMATSFTKTSFVTYGIIVALILLCNAQRVVKQRAMMIALACLPVVLIVGLILFQITTGTDIMTGIETRMNNTDSMTWREHVWDYLMTDMPIETWFTGHGYTAASERMQIFERFTEMNDSTANAIQVLAVHNSFLSQLYDFGIMGIILMIGLAIYAIKIIWRLFRQQSGTPALRAVDTTLLGMIVTYLMLCGVNNTFDMMQLPFWILVSVLFLARREMLAQHKNAFYEAARKLQVNP